MDLDWAVKFFHTYWYIEQGKEDPLKDPQFIRWFTRSLTGKSLCNDSEDEAKSETLTEAMALGEKLTALRDRLYPMILAIQTDGFDESAALNLLAPYIEGSVGRRRLVMPDDVTTEPKVVFESDRVDGAYVLSEFASAWFTLLFEKDRTRIHICSAPKCACLFVDTSKNHTKRYCTDRCGNVMKLRRHRSKKNEKNA